MNNIRFVLFFVLAVVCSKSYSSVGLCESLKILELKAFPNKLVMVPELPSGIPSSDWHFDVDTTASNNLGDLVKIAFSTGRKVTFTYNMKNDGEVTNSATPCDGTAFKNWEDGGYVRSITVSL